MNKIVAFAILAAACSSYSAQVGPPDEAPPSITLDARMPDAGPSPALIPPADLGGCANMGNLPSSRTITINTGDPIPPALINEIQDVIVAASRKPFSRSFYPKFIYFNTGSFIGSANGQPCLLASAHTIAFFEICYEPGETLTGLSIDVFGDAALPTLQMHIDYATGPGVAASVLSTVATYTPPQSWQNIVFSVTPQLLADGSYLHVDVTTSGGGIYLGRAKATFTR